MTTLGLRRVRHVDVRVILLAAGVALWTMVVVGGWLKLFKLPGGFGTRLMITFLVPPALVAWAFLRRGGIPAINHAATFTTATAAALTAPQLFSRNPVFAWGVAALLLIGLFAHRFPRGVVTMILVAIAANGTIMAFTPVRPLQVVTGFLLAMWAAMIGRLVIGRRPLPLRPSAGMYLLLLLFAWTIIAVMATSPLNQGTKEFTDVWLRLSMLLLIGYGAYSARVLDGVARSFVLIALLAGAYATLRWAIGAHPKETALNAGDQFRESYNSVDGEQKVQGSFFNGQQLAVWGSIAIPFCLAMAISWRGRWRTVAIAALPFSIIAMFGSGQRTVVPAVIAGALTVMVVHMVSRSFKGPRLGVALAAVLALVASAAVVYPAVLDNPDKRQRYENILNPSEDVPFQERLIKWNQVLDDLEGHPLGFGVGAGDSQIPKRFTDVAYNNIDNSYLMFAYDQGMFFAILFIITLFVVLFELIRHAVWTRGETSSALCTAAAGVLVSVMIELVAANQVNSPTILAAWLIVGIGIAQYGSRREAEPA